ncbi:uncharacterized protein EI97DRAFT_369538 [Westerdykella ornata]|uniref:HD/PDEase domain-containing protein n=1 Tax=Westerdykella ornata TaxID=318751 RepID=A0A6A6JW35_WESOR|nr:uncharacterized protein EI97DRAFT_369538 [Westerdykella ornata]KAF2280424.1 hypothetical protein EI97DRAFT_369538 [Westerdykella ornata]
MTRSLAVPAVPVREEHKALFASINAYVHDYMSQPGHDNSHDYHHILRVLSNANILLKSELDANPKSGLDTSAIFLAALLHDVGDHKYAKPGEDPENQAFNALRERGATEELARKVQVLVKHVGYTNEVRNPQSVVDVLSKYPELAIVQDADRLDAIGAVGAARCFAFGGAKGNGRTLAGGIDHFEEKLYRLKDMMKTTKGKEMALSRTKILEDLAVQFKRESELSFALD